MKDVRSREDGRFVQCGHFSDKEGGVLQMRTSSLLCKNPMCIWQIHIGFFEIYGVSARTRGGEGSFLSFFADVLYPKRKTWRFYVGSN